MPAPAHWPVARLILMTGLIAVGSWGDGKMGLSQQIPVEFEFKHFTDIVLVHLRQ